MKKKILSIILTVVMVIGMFPIATLTAFANNGVTLYYYIPIDSKELHISSWDRDNYISFRSDGMPPWNIQPVEEVYIDDVIMPASIAYWFCNGTSEDTIEESNISCFYGLGNIDMSNVENADYAFAGVQNATLDFDRIDLRKAKSAKGMFKDSSVTNVTVSKIQLSNDIKNTSYMFAGCSKLTEVVCPTLGDGVNAEGMFADTANMDTFTFCSNFCNPADFKGFLKGSGVSRVDTTKWVPTEGSDISEMFADCKRLVRISAAQNTDWSAVNGCIGTDLFKGCSVLVGSEGTRYSDYDNGLYFAKTDKVKTYGLNAAGYFFDITANTGLTVTRDGVAAVSGTDYELSGDKLTVKAPGLTISGATTSQYIQVNAEATDLTIEDLYIAVTGNHAISFSDNCKLILKGSNVLSTAKSNKCALYFNTDGEITGNGSLVASSSYSAIYSYSGGVTISATGLLLIHGGASGIEMGKSLKITNQVGRMLVYGEDDIRGAVTWHYSSANGNNVNVSSDLILKGSTAANTPESEITETATVNTYYYCFRVGDVPARSLLISHKSHDFSKGVYRTNVETHSRVCTCGYIDTPVAHDYSSVLYDNGDGTHCGRCICGVVNTSQKVKHKFVDGRCACGAVKAPVSEYFIIGGKAIGGGTQSESGIKYDGLYDSTIYVEKGTAATIRLYAAASSCWRYTEKTGDNWGVVYGSMPSEPINDDFSNSKESQWATITVSAEADDNDTLILQSGLYNDGQYENTVTTTIKVLSGENLAKKSISSITYPLYLTIGSGFVSLDNTNGTHYIASDYEIGTKQQEHSDKASDCLDAGLADDDNFISTQDHTVFGILDSTGEKTGSYISGIDMARVLDLIVEYNGNNSHSASYIYATDGKLITAGNKGNYEVVPVAIKMLNTADGEQGWYINTAIKRKAIIKYDLNTPSGANFTYRMMGSTSKAIYTTTVPGDVNAEMILTTGLGMPTHTSSGEVRSISVNDKVPVRYNNRDCDIIFLGWNTAKNGTGTMYAPTDKPELNRDTTLYAIWGASYSVYYYKDTYSKSGVGAIGTATSIGIIDNMITVPEGTDAGELNYKKSALGDNSEYYNNGVMVTSEEIKPNGTSVARVLYSQIEHIHTAGVEMMHNATAHWHVCGSTAGKCNLKTLEDYENAFAADTDGTLKEALNYEEHNNNLLLVDNGDGTHSPVCSCGVKNTAIKNTHVYSNGACICGAKEPVPYLNYGSFSYCGSRTFKTSVGTGRGVYWGIRIRGFEISSKGLEQLESISFREFETGGEYTLYLFSKGITETPNINPYSFYKDYDYEQTFTTGGTSGWKKVMLDQPYKLPANKDLWIVLYCDNILYPATACEYVSEEGSWISTDGANWMNVCNAGIEASWMIKANFNSEHVHNYIDGVCEGCGDIEIIPSDYGGCFSYIGSRNYATSWSPEYPPYWGIRIPDGTVPYSHLSEVMFYQGNESGNYRLFIYSTPHGAVPSDVHNPDYEQQFAVTGQPGWITIELATPYALRNNKDLWIVFFSDDIINSIICTDYVGTSESLWVSNGKNWHYSIAEGYYYSGMIKGCFENLQHTHVAGTTYMSDDTAHWYKCDAKNCPLGSVDNYKAAFDADTDGSIKKALGYEEHDFSAHLVDNGNGTHSNSCICGKKGADTENNPHVFTDGVCEECGCIEPVPVDNNGWFSYTGSREFFGGIVLANDMYWGIRVPGNKIEKYTHISKIQMYKGYAGGNFKLLLFSTPAGTKPDPLSQPDYEQTFINNSTSGWNTFELETPFKLTSGNDLWIVFLSDNIPCASYVNNDDGLLIYNGTTWVSSINAGYYYSCMVKGFFATIDTAKADAIAEITSARTDDNKEIADEAISKINAVAAIDQILPIKVQALADMKAADELATAKKEAIAAINAVKTAASEEIADEAIKSINAVTAIDQILLIKVQALADMKAADVLAEKREAAIAEIEAAASFDNGKIADEAIKNIYAAKDEETIESIKIKALADMKAADALVKAKQDAVNEIHDAYLGDKSYAIANEYEIRINAAKDADEVNSIKAEALAAIKQENAIYMAKANANAEILAAITATTEEIAEQACIDINAATDFQAIESIKAEALAAMKDAMDELAVAKLAAIRELIAKQTEHNISVFMAAVLGITNALTVEDVQSTMKSSILLMGIADVGYSSIKAIDAARTSKNDGIGVVAIKEISKLTEKLFMMLFSGIEEETLDEVLAAYGEAVNDIREKALIDMKAADYYSGISLTLDSDIYMNFYMELTEEERENGTMTFDIGGRTVTGVAPKYNKKENKYYFTCPITALEMAETVTAKFRYNDVEYIQKYSVDEYIEKILGGTDENGNPYPDKMKTLAKKIANYGHYAQTYLESIHTNVTIGNGGYAAMDKCKDVDINVGAAIEALEGYSLVVTGTSDNLSLYGSTVYFDSATALNYYVKVADGVQPTATCDGKTVIVTEYKGYTPTANEKVYIVSVKGITATELANNITVTVNEKLAITGSVFAYCNSVIKAHSFDGSTEKDTFAVNAMAAFYEYYKAAVAYAATQE